APLWMRKKREGWDQRCGHVDTMLKAQGEASRKRVMLHAVSVGEVNALRQLVPMLSEQVHVIVSVTTDTGLAQASRLFGEMDYVDVVRYPLDCSWMVNRFLDVVKPDVVGLVELEVWPNFVNMSVKRGIPIGIINGRLSARSFNGYRKVRFLLRPTFARLGFVCVQDQDYADRIVAMGTPSDRVQITGSMKWDAVDASVHTEPSSKATEIAEAMGIDLSRPIVVAGSTGPGEEAMLDRAIDQAVDSDVQLVIAPRKTDRFDEAADAMPGCVRRTANEKRDGATRFLLDTIGELSAVYELADVVIIGRSFFDLYGSDPVEPAAMGKPVLIGPRYSDFQQAMGALLEAGAVQVVDRQGVGGAVARLLGDSSLREAIGERARACVGGQQGASQRHCAVLMHQVGIKNTENGE
ncbi:MAG: 3-deoxy-D-manno-octulosonic acid transferase, partial [Phycisphaerales bacterium]